MLQPVAVCCRMLPYGARYACCCSIVAALQTSICLISRVPGIEYCSVLQCVALCCSAGRCRVLQGVAGCCSVSPRVAVCCRVLLQGVAFVRGLLVSLSTCLCVRVCVPYVCACVHMCVCERVCVYVLSMNVQKVCVCVCVCVMSICSYASFLVGCVGGLVGSWVLVRMRVHGVFLHVGGWG